MNHYQAHYAFIGNNEMFSVRTTSFGVKSRIESHGTFFYNPDDQDDRPRKDYTYDDAYESIEQPFFRPYIQVGILFPIG